MKMKCPECQFQNPEDTLFCGQCGARLKSTKKTGEKRPSYTKTLRIPLKELAIGETFAKRYQVIEDLGKGGMGRVYKVLDNEIKEIVALKILKPEIVEDERIIERFRNELKLARKISHKNICGMYHLSKDENGTHYITMEYVSGENLKSLIRRIGPLTVGKAVFIGKQICQGLSEAHRLGVIHRDLKSQNIMIDQEGHVRVMDFGIARSLMSKGLTDTGAIIGTPEYMAPEQVEGGETDARTDIYALGIVLYEMVTGRVPFGGDTALSVAFKQKNEIPGEPRKLNVQIPEKLNRAIMKCLEKDRARRYESAVALCEDLARVEESITSTGEIKRAKTREPRISPAPKSHRKWSVVAALACLLVVGAYMVWKNIRPAPPSDYENFLSLEWVPSGSPEIPQNLIEFLVQRSLAASTRWNIYVPEDILIYKKRTQDAEAKPKNPSLMITGEVLSKVTGGFEISISMRVRKKLSISKFECKGYLDFISGQIEKIHAFIADHSEGTVGPIEGNRTAAQIATSNRDALDHFLKGEDAWRKLDADTAYFEYRSALENDADFSLAHLKLADVLVFRSDRESARRSLEAALAKKDRLIENDLLRLQALLARIDSKPSEERQYLGKLTEEFPFKKEYHYEFAESYFHCGDADQAIKYYTKALELDPNYSRAHNHIAYCYAWIGNHKLAEEHFKKYVQLDHKANAYDSLAAGYRLAGRYDEALSALERGAELSPNLDYLYGSMARNYILKGALSKALEALRQQASVAKLDTTKMSSSFYAAYIEFLKGNPEKCLQTLAPLREYYSQKQFSRNLDEAPWLPFWFTGVIAAKRGDGQTLRREIDRMKEKIVQNGVSATNFFPIHKFYIHLAILEAARQGDVKGVLRNIEEGKRMWKKMGYRSSMFNCTFFFNEYAKTLNSLSRPVEALALLDDAHLYNPDYAAAHISLAKIHLQNGEKQKVRQEYEKARKLLDQADKDYILVSEMDRIGKKL
jgi:serine/threonine protein kinase/tetratricopeptide (TPR) repeat protein